MRNFSSSIIGASCGLTAMFVSGCFAQAKLTKEDIYQTKFLNSCFSVIKRNKVGVRVVVKPYQKISLMGGNRDIQVGTRFYYIEKDYSYHYEVKAVDTDGVRVSYKGHNEGKEVANVVKLKWKP